MEKTSSIFRKIIIWIGLVIVTFLTVTSFFQKCSFHWDETGQALPEMIYYEKNHFWILGVLTLVLVFGLKKMVLEKNGIIVFLFCDYCVNCLDCRISPGSSG